MALVRNIYGFLSASTDPYNMSIPWKISVQDGAFQMNYKKSDAIRDNLICWANTNWGERPMRFRFGLDARRSLFEPIEIAKEKLRNNTNQQLPIYFEEVVIDSLEVLSSQEDETVPENSLRYRLVVHLKEDETQVISINVVLGN